ncbi:carbon-nitrogen family hydrolase [Lachnospiraceae bacterium 46-61]
MKVALAQLDIAWENKQENQKRCCAMLEQAKKQCAELIIFPEMTLTGFSMNTDTYGETMENSSSIAFFQQKAIEYQIAITFGIIIKNGEKSENHCVTIDETGNIISDYAKIHPFSYGSESKFYSSGENVSFFNIKGIPFSPLICYDLRFPEIFQVCSIKSHVITIIANWPTPRRCHWISLLKARAIENQCYILGVNRCGSGDGLDYSGDSMIIDPYGKIVAMAKECSQVITADIDDNIVTKYRQEFPLKADRKPLLYSQLYQNKK